MKKVIMIAVMAALIPATSVWAEADHDPAVPQSTQKISSGRLHMEHQREKMSGKMSHKERGTMFNSTAKRSSDRLQGKREKMSEKMSHRKQGPMFEPKYKRSSDRLYEKSEK